MLDMIGPAQPGCISLKDLKRCQLAPIFFDTFFNLDKYLDREQKDPFSNLKVSSKAVVGILFFIVTRSVVQHTSRGLRRQAEAF